MVCALQLSRPGPVPAGQQLVELLSVVQSITETSPGACLRISQRQRRIETFGNVTGHT